MESLHQKSKLAGAILYSYLRDLRFVLVTWLLIGFSIWWFAVSEPLMENLGPLCEIAQADLGKLVQTRVMCVNKLCTYYAAFAKLE